MPEINQSEEKASRKRKINEVRDENDEYCEIVKVKRSKANTSIFSNVFQRLSDWVKKTSGQRPRLFGLLSERNSAADAIAGGGQYLDEATTDMFMPQSQLKHTSSARVVGNGSYITSTVPSTSLPDNSLSSAHQKLPQNSTSLPVIRIPHRQLVSAQPSGSRLSQHQQSTNSQMAHHRSSEPQRCAKKSGPVSANYNNETINCTAMRHTGIPDTNHTSSSPGFSGDLERNSLQRTYIEQQQQDVRRKDKKNVSIYEKVCSQTSAYFNSTPSSKKTTLQKCFDLDEKERYKRLLQMHSVTDMPTVQSLARFSTRPTITTVTEQPLKKFLFTHATNNSSVSVLDTPASTPSHSPGKAGCDYATPTCPPQTASASAASTRPKRETPRVPTFGSNKSTIPETVPPSDMAVKCDALMKQMDQIKHRASSRLNQQRKLALEEEAILSAYQKKREEDDDLLRRMVEQRLKLTPSIILDDVPVEEEEEEAEVDEFPALSDEAEARVDKALSAGPNNILSEAFRLKISRRDLYTLRGIEWLNDEIVNFYFNLIQERSTQENNLPSVFVFNTFFYPKLMKSGHAGLKRWTKQVDIFAKDLILIPIHLGMHWCLACISFRDHAIYYYDSMGGTKWDCVQALKNYIEDESMDKKKQPYDTSDWVLDCVRDIPQQMNGSDCGVFTCKYAEYLSRNAPFTFGQEHMPYFRRRMVYEILSKSLL